MSAPLTTAADRRTIILHEIGAERDRQDAKWGDPADYDMHTPGSWFDLIIDEATDDHDVMTYHYKRVLEGQKEPTAHDLAHMDRLCRNRLVKIAALAIAGIEAIDRIDRGVK
ncbi:MAG: hypothetical protein QJR04_25355 [Burkholderia multivorans]|nr:hypothetical protein [Burkholderia multivorans]